MNIKYMIKIIKQSDARDCLITNQSKAKGSSLRRSLLYNDCCIWECKKRVIIIHSFIDMAGIISFFIFKCLIICVI